jgi:hypothetical protein
MERERASSGVPPALRLSPRPLHAAMSSASRTALPFCAMDALPEHERCATPPVSRGRLRNKRMTSVECGGGRAPTLLPPIPPPLTSPTTSHLSLLPPPSSHLSPQCPPGTRLTFLDANWNVGKTPRQSNSFYSPWFGSDPADNLNLIQPVNPWMGNEWLIYNECA